MKRYVLAWYTRDAFSLRRRGLPQVARTCLLAVGAAAYAAGNAADDLGRRKHVAIVRVYAYDPNLAPSAMLARAAIDLGVTVDSIPRA